MERKTQRKVNFSLSNWLWLLKNKLTNESISDFVNRIVTLYRQMSGKD